MLGGVALALGLESVVSNQAHAATGTDGAGNYSIVQPDDLAIRELRQLADIQTASKNFGDIDWKNVFLVKENGQVGYVLFFKVDNSLATSQVTYLVTNKATANQHVKTLVGRTLFNKDHMTEEQWFTASGLHLGTLKFNQASKPTTIVNELPTNAVIPLGLNFGCFTACLSAKRIAYCTIPCRLCIPGILPACSACWLCGGVAAFSCVQDCWQ